MKDIICNNKEEFLRITNLLLKNNYKLERNYYSENPNFSIYDTIVIICIYDSKIIDWKYTGWIQNKIYAKDFINELRKDKLKRIYE